ncbi:RNA polymerase sigma factor [Chryseobacterium gambrini]|jgi:RNA polymerase sigma-70 factor (ECF subfamily)|uniref:RNA polymerase sigma factor n=1 Tax=Chryseobacterium gambrini TaxID=373672 RepID=A0AAJ1VK52_9FLAO|nr:MULTISPECIES: RNA polymerase sigma factor [Chryseobacterium]MDN4013910.1 RNA polymerase sigma factor [Chryseobacterium gambrini]MDN4031238.1 RNA polymerase sigma factor [Chryseobacterium gambrini]QWA39597.1 RNA polymerase sigma factor [Chryseobacterium sp. ZHDP1]
MTSLEQDFLREIEKHKGIIFKISKMYMDEKEDRDDLFQEITYQVWKAYPKFKGESEFSTWLYRIALNTAIIFLKNEKRRSFIGNEDFSEYKIIQEEFDHEKEEKLNAMYKAIHQLNPIDKAFIFYYLEDFSGKQIAEQMGISEGNVRVKMNRAKNKLKDILNANK